MRLIPSDPDIATLVSRIRSGDINLQPHFQRGEVWGEAKKQRLIDTILRDWHVPPIHVVEVRESGLQEVLDGQQRLVAIRDFVNGEIKIDGFIEPIFHDIKLLDGLTYSRLPDSWRRKVEQFTIRVFKITDYDPEEPGELFYRLNQPVSLTSAEQRNAFFGPARQQVKELVSLLESVGVDRNSVGFSNSRMAYDDVVARVCLSLDVGSLREKITSTVLANRYRSDVPFSDEVVRCMNRGIRVFGEVLQHLGGRVKHNKATMYSWLCFIVGLQDLEKIKLDASDLAKFMYAFEEARSSLVFSEYFMSRPESKKVAKYYFHDTLVMTYNDRSSSRVADVSSVLSRDIVLWTFYCLSEMPVHNSETGLVAERANLILETLWHLPSDIRSSDVYIETLTNMHHWGELR